MLRIFKKQKVFLLWFFSQRQELEVFFSHWSPPVERWRNGRPDAFLMSNRHYSKLLLYEANIKVDEKEMVTTKFFAFLKFFLFFSGKKYSFDYHPIVSTRLYVS